MHYNQKVPIIFYLLQYKLTKIDTKSKFPSYVRYFWQIKTE